MPKLKVSETITENLFREYYGATEFIEKSAIPSDYGFVSKKGSKEQGYPDFFKDLADYAIIVEAKADDFKKAESEAKFYAEHNNIDKDIIIIAIAGQSLNDLKVIYSLKLKGKKNYILIKTNNNLIQLDQLHKLYLKTKYGEFLSADALRRILQELNETFHNHLKIRDTERSLFFAGLMIALCDENFRNTYKSTSTPNNGNDNLFESHHLNEAIIDAITRQISTKVNNYSKENNWSDRFSFIRNVDYPLAEYKAVISKIETNIFIPFKNDEKQDILGRAYKIFLSKAGKVDNKNIILTPDHIKQLMIELARLSIHDVVLDTCTGSGGFLMEAMEVMLRLAENDKQSINDIREKQLIGFELDSVLFALACSNMFLHGDGRTNMIYGSSLFDINDQKQKKVFDYIRSLHPTKCIINPPYEKNSPIKFTKQALELLDSGGKLVIIMPTPTLNRNIKGLTDEILKIAKLDFVIKMPNNLFSEQNRTVNTSIFGFTKTPFNDSDFVVYYNMEDDGLVSVQHKGRIDKNNRWTTIHDGVVNCISNGSNSIHAEKRRIVKYINGEKTLNCYGFREEDNNDELVAMGQLFTFSEGSLASDNCNNEGEYDFITAAETWKRHDSYDNECEALVYATKAAGSLGRTHYVNGKFIASNLCLILKEKDHERYPVNMRFYSFYFNQIRKTIEREIADGTSKLTIAQKDLEDYLIKYYPLDIQNRYAQLYEEKVLAKKKELEDALSLFENSIRKIL